jgi:hypothetical protein
MRNLVAGMRWEVVRKGGGMVCACACADGVPGRERVKGGFIRVAYFGSFEVASSQFCGCSRPRGA